MIAFLEHQPPVSSKDFAIAEQRLAQIGHRIPPSYRAFLAEHDGGEPVQDYFSFQHDDRTENDLVKVFLGIAPSPDGDIVDVARTLGERVPAGVLPIARDPVGNFICLDVRDGRDGPVLFWDHEYEGDPPDEANLYVIAPDLQTFLEGLVENPDPPRVDPKPRGLRRLLRGH